MYAIRRLPLLFWPVIEPVILRALALRAAVAERLARSPLTKVNRAQYPAGSRIFVYGNRMMPVVGGYSQGYPDSTAPPLQFRCLSILTSIIPIGIQVLAVKSRPRWLLETGRASPNPGKRTPPPPTANQEAGRIAICDANIWRYSVVGGVFLRRDADQNGIPQEIAVPCAVTPHQYYSLGTRHKVGQTSIIQILSPSLLRARLQPIRVLAIFLRADGRMASIGVSNLAIGLGAELRTRGGQGLVRADGQADEKDAQSKGRKRHIGRELCRESVGNDTATAQLFSAVVLHGRRHEQRERERVAPPLRAAGILSSRWCSLPWFLVSSGGFLLTVICQCTPRLSQSLSWILLNDGILDAHLMVSWEKKLTLRARDDWLGVWECEITQPSRHVCSITLHEDELEFLLKESEKSDAPSRDPLCSEVEVLVERLYLFSNGLGKREIPEKTRRPTASSGPIPTCENLVTRPGIKSGSHWWEASVLIAQPPYPAWEELCYQAESPSPLLVHVYRFGITYACKTNMATIVLPSKSELRKS
ncbi:hypothetical protein PR048_019544 [Dryococelus australis]|uniref:Uncharacterized protein n=1 Tax=Dryococelus australis TaxID=614101 RepID=A0ABQ9H3R5_9NEOP|nr:hypothetical protein PR048_019544 [Dryococelus australis]